MNHIALQLKDIYLEKKTGQLFFQQGDIRKHLYFVKGDMVYARTNQPKELLGEVLFRLGKIPEEVHSRLDEFIEPKKNLGTILIEKELISKDELQDALAFQMREITMNLFPLFEGTFKFQAKSGFAEEAFEVTSGTSALVEEGIRHMKYDPRLQAFMDGKIPKVKDKTYFFRLTAEERDVFAAIDGESTSNHILTQGEFDADRFWKSLYLFFCLNLVEIDRAEAGVGEDKETAGGEDPTQDPRIMEILEMSDRLSSSDYYQLLKVSAEASPADIKKAYFKMARRYHPDLFQRGLPQEVKTKIDEVFDTLTKGYHILSDENKRKEYDEKRDVPIKEDKRDVDKRAEVRFRQGKTLYDQTRFEEALVVLQEAVRLDPYKSRYFLLLAMTQAKVPAYRKKSVDSFQKAIQMEPWNPDSYVGLGMLYKKEGMTVMAKKYIKKALQVDPDHKGARKALLDLEGKTEKKSLKDMLSLNFKDIFKKKS